MASPQPQRSSASEPGASEGRYIRPADDQSRHGGEPPTPPETHSKGYAATPDLTVVFEITKAAVDLQFRISERIDLKIRNYFGAAATVFGVVQALVLVRGVEKALGDRAGGLEGLTVAGAALLAVALVVVIVVVRPRTEADIPAEKLRELLNRSYQEETKAPGEGVNLLIGLLERRKGVNEDRLCGLRAVMLLTGLLGVISVAQLVLVVLTVI